MDFRNSVRCYPVTWYFICTYAISWLGALILIAPKLLRGQHLEKMDGIQMFPIMIIGPAVSGVLFTSMTEGRKGLRNLWFRIKKWRVSIKWYLFAILTPLCLVLVTLVLMQRIISPSFGPNFFVFGFLFGIPAVILEEVGWTGFALPHLRLKRDLLVSGIILGSLWALWHIPVIDFLGSASPHGSYLVLFFLSFSSILMAMRLLMSWVYSNSNSILLAQFMHAMSTGCLATFGPVALRPGQEALWYALYSLLLWVVVLFIFRKPFLKRIP